MLLQNVFGVSNQKVTSYVEREDVDVRFIEGLKRNKHIIVFGSSKQGKTSLTNKHLNEDDFIRINCSPSSNTLDIYQSVLRQLDVSFEIEHTKKNAREISGEISVEATVKIPFINTSVEGDFSAKNTSQNEKKFEQIKYNLTNPQDISEILKKLSFSKRIILENFHYLNESVQKALAFDLRVFEDYNILFIILGIWREKNRLPQFNGDLQDRLIEIPVEPWKKQHFEAVAEQGSEILNVSFENIINAMIENSYDSIGVFQELCKECCAFADIKESKENFNKLELTNENLKAAITKKLEDYSGRHIRSIEAFVEPRSRKDDKPLYIGYFFIKYLFSLDLKNIESGLKRTDIHEGIKKIHHRPNDVRPSDMSNFLHKITANQVKKQINPPLFDYDRSTKQLKVIDSTLYFFLRNVDKKEFLSDLDDSLKIETNMEVVT